MCELLCNVYNVHAFSERPFIFGFPVNDTSGMIYINASIGVILQRRVRAHAPGFIPCEPGVICVNNTSVLKLASVSSLTE